MSAGRAASAALALATAAALLGAVPAHAQDDAARARKIVSGVCFLCHGAEGESASEVFPRLAGQNAEYIAKQLENFQSGKRQSTAMREMVANLSPPEMRALGVFFASQPTHREPVKDAPLAAVGEYLYLHGNRFSSIPACASCHGADAHGTALLPRLAGQHAAYLEAQLKQFGQRERSNDNAVMHSIAVKMSPLEMAAVAEYLSGR